MDSNETAEVRRVAVELRLRYIADQHEMLHLLPFDLICETAGEAAAEIERLRAEAPRWKNAWEDQEGRIWFRGWDDEPPRSEEGHWQPIQIATRPRPERDSNG